MTDIVCKCGVSRLEDIQCAVCGEYFKAGWIPVSERLPKKNGIYLIYYKCADEVMFILRAEYKSGKWLEVENTDYYGYTMSYVEYWMPLPPPPQEAE